MNRRFMSLARDVRLTFTREKALTVNEPAFPRQFDFPTSAEKLAAFQRWLQNQIESGILEVVIRRGAGQGVTRHWQNVFLQSAYIRGVRDTEVLLKQEDMLLVPLPDIELGVISTGVHAETLALVYARAFEGLKGITDAMSSQLSIIFSDALIEGVGPAEISRRITAQIGKISRTRAMVLARTETIRAFNESRLNTMELNQVEGVTADVEFLTAKDSRVCSICKDLLGKVYKVSESHGIIPIHPQCRCTWKPVNIGVEQDAA